MKRFIKHFLVDLAALFLAIVVFAVSTNFFEGRIFQSSNGPVIYFSFEDVYPFAENVDLGHGDSVSVYPKITSTASVDMYPVMVVTMPIFNGGPLYNVTPGSGWSLVESYECSEGWRNAYLYESVISPEEDTGDGEWVMTMVDMSNKCYGEIQDFRYQFRGYALGTDNETDPWPDLKANYGL